MDVPWRTEGGGQKTRSEGRGQKAEGRGASRTLLPSAFCPRSARRRPRIPRKTPVGHRPRGPALVLCRLSRGGALAPCVDAHVIEGRLAAVAGHELFVVLVGDRGHGVE